MYPKADKPAHDIFHGHLSRDRRGSIRRSLHRKGLPTDRAISGDAAWETGTWTATDKSGATADMGKYVTAYRKKDGKWLIAADIWNSDKAPAPPPPAEPAKK